MFPDGTIRPTKSSGEGTGGGPSGGFPQDGHTAAPSAHSLPHSVHRTDGDSPRTAQEVKETDEVGGWPPGAKRVPARGYPARPYRARSAKDALAKVDMSKEVIDLWNRAA